VRTGVAVALMLAGSGLVLWAVIQMTAKTDRGRGWRPFAYLG